MLRTVKVSDLSLNGQLTLFLYMCCAISSILHAYHVFFVNFKAAESPMSLLLQLFKAKSVMQASTLRKFFVRQLHGQNSKVARQLRTYASQVLTFQYENCFTLSAILADIFLKLSFKIFVHFGGKTGVKVEAWLCFCEYARKTKSGGKTFE